MLNVVSVAASLIITTPPSETSVLEHTAVIHAQRHLPQKVVNLE